jgi:nucleoside-diphosphate-sugar epimerase
MAAAAWVTGAAGSVGAKIVPMLLERDCRVELLSRRRHASAPAGARWHALDLEKLDSDLPDARAETLFHTAAIWLLPDWLDKFRNHGVSRIVAFSSTSRFTKVSSGSEKEREVVAKLSSAEERVAARCERLGMTWTILRPTLIYGGVPGADRNVGDIGRFVHRFRFFPILGPGNGLRQPVLAEDLARGALQASESLWAANKAYNLSGGETLPYVEMVKRICTAVGRRPLVLRVPEFGFRIALRFARLHPRFRHLTPDMARRMSQDLVFDHSDAAGDFGYAPKRFSPEYLADPAARG